MYLLFKVSSFMKKKKEEKRNIGIVVSIKMTMIPYVKNDLFNSEVQFFFYFLN